MSYVSGGIIENEDYNSLSASVNEVLNDIHQGSTTENIANYGYGQNRPFRRKNNGEIVTADDWDRLVKEVKNIATFQGTTIGTIPSAINIGDIIEAIAALSTAINSIRTNRLNATSSRMLITTNGAKLKDSRSGAFDDIYHEFSATFINWNHARYFFNAGGEIRLSPKFTSPSTGINDQNWKTLFNKITYISFGDSSTIRVGTGSYTNTNGFYDLTNTYKTVYSDNITGITLKLEAKLNANPGIARSIIFKLSLTTGTGISIGNVYNNVDTATANSTTVKTNTPTFLTLVPFSGSGPAVEYDPNITMATLPQRLGERRKQYEVEKDGDYHVLNLTNVTALDFSNVSQNDPEKLVMTVNGVPTSFGYSYDSETNLEKLVGQNKQGKVTIYRDPSNRSLATRQVFFETLDVQQSSNLVFTYEVTTVLGSKITKTFTIPLTDNMFSWDNASSIGSISGNSYNSGVLVDKTQRQFGARDIIVDGSNVVVCGSGRNGFYVEKIDKANGNYTIRKTHSIGTTRACDAFNIIKMSGYNKYIVVGKCLDENFISRGFISILNNDLLLDTAFNGTGYYIDQGEDCSYLDLMYVPSTSTSSLRDRYVVLFSTMSDKTKLFIRHFDSSSVTDTVLTVFNSSYEYDHYFGKPTLFMDGDSLRLFIPATPLNRNTYNATFGWECGKIISDIGNSPNTTTLYDPVFSAISNGKHTDTPILNPVVTETKKYESLYPSLYRGGVIKVTGNQTYIVQPYKIGKYDGTTYGDISYGVKIRRYIKDTNGNYIVDSTFAKAESSNTWYSNININVQDITFPISSTQIMCPISMNIISGTIVVANTYRPNATEVERHKFRHDLVNSSGMYLAREFDDDGYENSVAWSSVMDGVSSFIVGTYTQYGSTERKDQTNTTVPYGATILKASIIDETVGDQETALDVVIDNAFSGDGHQYFNTASANYKDANATQIYNIIGSQLGGSVAISTDGSIAISGAIKGNSGLGEVWVFIKNTEGKYVKSNGSTITAPANVKNFGQVVDVTDDKMYILISGTLINENKGVVFLYKKGITNVWTLASTLTGSVGLSYGKSCSISGDGTLIAVSEPEWDYSTILNVGRVFLYKNDGTTVTLSQTITGPNTITANDAGRYFGNEVRLSSKNYEYSAAYSGYVLSITRPNQKINTTSNAGIVDIYHSLNGTGTFSHGRSISNQIPVANGTFGKYFYMGSRGLDVGVTHIANGKLQVIIISHKEVSDSLVEVARYTLNVEDDIGFNVYPISLSMGHDGRTVAVGVNSSDPEKKPTVLVYHRIGKDEPYKLVNGKYEEQYKLETIFSTPSAFDPSDSGDLYGKVAIADDNNYIIVGSSGNEVSENPDENIGKVYFYSAEARAVEFSLALDFGQTSVVENNYGEYLNSISGKITYYTDVSFLEQEEVSIDDVMYIVGDRTDRIIKAPRGYLTITKDTDATRVFKFYPSYNIRNWDDANGVKIDIPVKIQYTSISTTGIKYSVSEEILVSDGTIHTLNSFMPSTIDNAYDIRPNGSMLGTSFYGNVSYIKKSDEISYEKLQLTYKDDANQTISTDVVNVNKTSNTNAILDCGNITVSPPLSNQDKKYTVTISGITNGGKSFTSNPPTVSSFATLKSIHAYATDDTLGIKTTSYVVVLNGLVPKEHFNKITIRGLFEADNNGAKTIDSYVTTINLNCNENYLGFTQSGESEIYNYDATANTTTFTFITNSHSGLFINDINPDIVNQSYNISFYENRIYGNFIPGYYKIDSANVIGGIQFRSPTTTMISGSIGITLSDGERCEFYSQPSTSGTKYKLIIEGTHDRDAVHSISLFGKLARGRTPLLLNGAKNSTFIKDSSPTYFILNTSDSATTTTISGPRVGELTNSAKYANRIAALIPRCTSHTQANGYTTWEWTSALNTNDYGMLIPSELYTLNIYYGKTSHTLTANSYGRSTVNASSEHGYISYKEKNAVYDLFPNINAGIYPKTFENFKIAGVYTKPGTNTTKPKFVVEIRGTHPQTLINKVSVNGQFEIAANNYIAATYVYATDESNFLGVSSAYVGGVTDNQDDNYVTKWEWEITNTGTYYNRYKMMYSPNSNQYQIKINDGTTYVKTLSNTTVQTGGTNYSITIKAGASPSNGLATSIGYDNIPATDVGLVTSGSIPNLKSIISSPVFYDPITPDVDEHTNVYVGNVEYVVRMGGAGAAQLPINYFGSIEITPTVSYTFTTALSNQLRYNPSLSVNSIEPWASTKNNAPIILNPLILKEGGKINDGSPPPTISGVVYDSTAKLTSVKIKNIYTDVTPTVSGTVNLTEQQTNGKLETVYFYNKPFLKGYEYNQTTGITTWTFVIGAPIYDPTLSHTPSTSGLSFKKDASYTVDFNNVQSVSNNPIAITNKTEIKDRKVNYREKVSYYTSDCYRFVNIKTQPSIIDVAQPPIIVGGVITETFNFNSFVTVPTRQSGIVGSIYYGYAFSFPLNPTTPVYDMLPETTTNSNVLDTGIWDYNPISSSPNPYADFDKYTGVGVNAISNYGDPDDSVINITLDGGGRIFFIGISTFKADDGYLPFSIVLGAQDVDFSKMTSLEIKDKNEVMFSCDPSMFITKVAISADAKSSNVIFPKNDTIDSDEDLVAQISLHDPAAHPIYSTSGTIIKYGNGYSILAFTPNRAGYTYRLQNERMANFDIVIEHEITGGGTPVVDGDNTPDVEGYAIIVNNQTLTLGNTIEFKYEVSDIDNNVLYDTSNIEVDQPFYSEVSPSQYSFIKNTLYAVGPDAETTRPTYFDQELPAAKYNWIAKLAPTPSYTTSSVSVGGVKLTDDDVIEAASINIYTTGQTVVSTDTKAFDSSLKYVDDNANYYVQLTMYKFRSDI